MIGAFSSTSLLYAISFYFRNKDAASSGLKRNNSELLELLIIRIDNI
jgi:hypothetical protein